MNYEEDDLYCEWTREYGDFNWDTSCEHVYMPYVGGTVYPIASQYGDVCPWCHKPILYNEERDPDADDYYYDNEEQEEDDE